MYIFSTEKYDLTRYTDTTITHSVLNECNIDYSEDEEKIQLVDCNKFIACAYKIIQELSFHNLFTIYNYMLLLPSTQMTCEKVFSKLKLVKSKIRSTISQQHLSPLMLMTIEKDIKIQKTKIIDTVLNRLKY